jgi:hypothetical protein
MFQNFRSHFKILCPSIVTLNWIHTETPSQILQNLVFRSTSRPGYEHPCREICKWSLNIEIKIWESIRGSTREIYETDTWSDVVMQKKCEGIYLLCGEDNIMEETEV